MLTWDGRVSTEERLALDLPVDALREMTWAATDRAKKGLNSVRDALAGALGLPRADFGDDPRAWMDPVPEAAFRTALGAQAKAHGWFKSQEGGAFLGDLVWAHREAMAATPTMAVINGLRTFAHGA